VRPAFEIDRERIALCVDVPPKIVSEFGFRFVCPIANRRAFRPIDDVPFKDDREVVFNPRDRNLMRRTVHQDIVSDGIISAVMLME
jgi:hypothetical protein